MLTCISLIMNVNEKSVPCLLVMNWLLIVLSFNRIFLCSLFIWQRSFYNKERSLWWIIWVAKLPSVYYFSFGFMYFLCKTHLVCVIWLCSSGLDASQSQIETLWTGVEKEADPLLMYVLQIMWTETSGLPTARRDPPSRPAAPWSHEPTRQHLCSVLTQHGGCWTPKHAPFTPDPVPLTYFQYSVVK